MKVKINSDQIVRLLMLYINIKAFEQSYKTTVKKFIFNNIKDRTKKN